MPQTMDAFFNEYQQVKTSIQGQERKKEKKLGVE